MLLLQQTESVLDLEYYLPGTWQLWVNRIYVSSAKARRDCLFLLVVQLLPKKRAWGYSYMVTGVNHVPQSGSFDA